MGYRRAKSLDKNLIFAEYFNSEQEVRRNGGVPTDVTFENGTIEFNGTGSKMEFPLFTPFLNEAWSIRSKIYLNNYSKYAFLAVLYDYNTLELRVDKTTGVLVLYLSGNKKTTSTTIPLNESTEILVTHDGNITTNFYVNGIYVDTYSASFNGNINRNPLTIGNRTILYSNHIHELTEFYNKALTAEEVTNLYNNARYVVPNLNKEEQVGTQNLIQFQNLNSVSHSNLNITYSDGVNYCIATSDNAHAYEPISVESGAYYRWSYKVKSDANNPPVNLDKAIWDQQNVGFILAPVPIYSELNSDTYTEIIVDFRVPAGCTQIRPYAIRDLDSGEACYIKEMSLTKFAVKETSKILHVTARDGVVLEKTDQNTITASNMSVFKDGSIRVMDFNGASSVIESTLADNVNTISFWCKPNSADESIIDLGGGNTITIASGVLTAAWADDIYVNGQSGTAILHPEWNHIVCRVDTALALTDIDIGKISTAFFDGKLSDVIFVDGIVSDNKISQMYSSQKHLYGK